MSDPAFAPRAYQADLTKQILAAIADKKNPLAQLATGAGKTVIAAQVIHAYVGYGFRVWFVCHRREILDQTRRTLSGHGIESGTVASRVKYDPKPLVHVCSVGALPHRLDKIEAPKLIIWDECHHMASPSWSALREKFPDAYHLGLTATPDRLDGLGLGDWFDVILCGPPTRDLIEGGHLSRFRIFAPIIPDMRGVKERKGDYLRADLARAMDKPSLVGDVVDHYQRITPGKTALLFAVSVEASRNVVDRFNVLGVPALHVDADTSPDDRHAAIEALRTGRVKVLSNVELFTEGFDCPAVDAVILLRPTRSLALYLQMVGRGLRPSPGKEPTIILDHSGLVHAHGMPDDPVDWSLGGELRREGPGGSRLRRCPSCSAVHEWAAECVECGHVYAEAYRSIDEVYGELEEVRRMPCPPGYETQSAFSRRVGLRDATIFKFIRKGMPGSAQGYIEIDAALDWIEKKKTGNPNIGKSIVCGPPGHETLAAFARRVGAGESTIFSMRLRGLPHDHVSGWINIKSGTKWFNDNFDQQNSHTQKIHRGSEKKTPPVGFCIASQFARTQSLTADTIKKYKGLGMPHDEKTGFVEVGPASAWIAEYRSRRRASFLGWGRGCRKIIPPSRRLTPQKGVDEPASGVAVTFSQ
jgi:DNA repair protein RadD